MAQFSYEDYQKQQNERKANNSQQGKGSAIHFVNEYLKNDGDCVVVRFPYHSLADMKFETTHKVTFPGEKFPKRVRCDGDDCPLCKQGVKLDTRFFLKAIVYLQNLTTGEVELVPAIWDRPSAFADIELKNLIQEYGDLTENLFKIKRNGSGLDTRYTISIIMNKTVYNPEVYKADFSELEKIDPVKILTKSIQQYVEALNPSAKKEEPQGTTTVAEEVRPVVQEKVVETPHVEAQQVEVEQQEPAPSKKEEEGSSSGKTRIPRYTF